jgi:hypothetical protein
VGPLGALVAGIRRDIRDTPRIGHGHRLFKAGSLVPSFSPAFRGVAVRCDT